MVARVVVHVFNCVCTSYMYVRGIVCEVKQLGWEDAFAKRKGSCEAHFALEQGKELQYNSQYQPAQ